MNLTELSEFFKLIEEKNYSQDLLERERIEKTLDRMLDDAKIR